MHDNYEIPALALTACLLPGFAYLHWRYRGRRTRMWLLGFLLSTLRMLQRYDVGLWDVSNSLLHPWLSAAGEIAIQIGSILFVSSLIDKYIKIGRFKVPCSIPYALPLVVYSILYFGVFRMHPAQGFAAWVLPILWLLIVAMAFLWAALPDRSNTISRPASLAFVSVLTSFSAFVYFTQGPGWILPYTECCAHIMTAALLLFAYRRLSPGTGLAVLGFSAWSLIIFWAFPFTGRHPFLESNLTHFIVLGKVVAALGLLLLALEEEVAANKAAEERERQVRRELEAYTNLILSRRRLEDFDNQAPDICQTIIANSRFSQAALLLLQPSGLYRLAGIAGFSDAIATALDALALRLPALEFLAPGAATPIFDSNIAFAVDFDPWLAPGDDLKRLGFTSSLAVPMRNRATTEGVLLLAGVRNRTTKDPLRADDLLPVEMLTTRMQAVRSQTAMLEKLIDSEKFAGLGQLAGNVTQELNNPLTVILGYAQLLEESNHLDSDARKQVDAILSEARNMRSTLESLTRVARAHTGQPVAVSVAEMLADMRRLYLSEFHQRSIELKVDVSPSLPRVLCHAQQLRQAVLHCLHFAMDAVESTEPSNSKIVRLEAALREGRVEILVAHSGRGFEDTERAFDRFSAPQDTSGETAGLGLSLCATILRDNDGVAQAVNFAPSGAGILLNLRAA